MKPTKFLIPVVILSFALTLGASKPDTASVLSRGKVVTGSGSVGTPKINKASFLPMFSEEVPTEGFICVYDGNGKKTDQLIPFDNIQFPGWFIPGCDDSGMVVEYKTYVKNGKTRAKIRKFKQDKKVK